MNKIVSLLIAALVGFGCGPQTDISSPVTPLTADEFAAGVLAMIGLHDESIEAYTRVVTRYPNRIESYLLMANVMRDSGRRRQALLEYRLALRHRAEREAETARRILASPDAVWRRYVRGDWLAESFPRRLDAGLGLGHEHRVAVEHEGVPAPQAGALLAPIPGEPEQQRLAPAHQVAVVVLADTRLRDGARDASGDLAGQHPDAVGMDLADLRSLLRGVVLVEHAPETREQRLDPDPPRRTYPC